MGRTEARIFLAEIGATTDEVDKLFEEVDERQGWTVFTPIGDKDTSVCLARIPGAHGSRTQNYQVTVR